MVQFNIIEYLRERGIIPLKSGETIKTINEQSILGSGNITISGGEGTDDYEALTNKPRINNIELAKETLSKDLNLEYSDLNQETLPTINGIPLTNSTIIPDDNEKITYLDTDTDQVNDISLIVYTDGYQELFFDDCSKASGLEQYTEVYDQDQTARLDFDSDLKCYTVTDDTPTTTIYQGWRIPTFRNLKKYDVNIKIAQTKPYSPDTYVGLAVTNSDDSYTFRSFISLTSGSGQYGVRGGLKQFTNRLTITDEITTTLKCNGDSKPHSVMFTNSEGESVGANDFTIPDLDETNIYLLFMHLYESASTFCHVKEISVDGELI